jgi:hypothetical protein
MKSIFLPISASYTNNCYYGDRQSCFQAIVKRIHKVRYQKGSHPEQFEGKYRQERSTLIQGGSNMTGTNLCVNKPHCAAAVRP